MNRALHISRPKAPTSRQRCGADNSVQFGDFCARTGDQAGAGVSDCLASSVAELFAVVGDRHSIHCELPVADSGDVRVREFALVVLWICLARESWLVN